jgi:hypothetical protein
MDLDSDDDDEEGDPEQENQGHGQEIVGRRAKRSLGWVPFFPRHFVPGRAPARGTWVPADTCPQNEQTSSRPGDLGPSRHLSPKLGEVGFEPGQVRTWGTGGVLLPHAKARNTKKWSIATQIMMSSVVHGVALYVCC